MKISANKTAVANNPQTAYNLKKSIVDLSKTKKRKEFEHDSKI